MFDRLRIPDLLNLVQKQIQLKKPSKEEEELIEREAKIGGQLFGSVPENHDRKFFRDDLRTWIWSEKWTDQSGKKKNITIRYEVQSDRVVKFQDGRYFDIDEKEARRLYQAAYAYCFKTKELLYPKAVLK
jgi:hypothetical protein